MPKILPFRGILYNVSKVHAEDVLAPPYDIITSERQEELYKRSPYNIVRVDLGKEYPDDNERENKYSRARQHLEAWMREGILIRSEEPSFYAYEMSYIINGRNKRLTGFLGLVQLEELGKGKIYPHECTYSRPKQDRLNLLRSCEANISPIFSLYKSSENGISAILSEVSSATPYIEARDVDGAIHKIWPFDDQKKIEIITRELEDKPIFIADGHHRYETAFEFNREMRRIKNLGIQSYDYVLMFLVNIMDEGITILPTHRLVKETGRNIINKIPPEFFSVEPVESDFYVEGRLGGQKGRFGLFQNRDEKWYLLKHMGGDLSELPPDLRDIDVFILHELVLKKILKTTEIGYEMAVETALDKVRKGQYTAAFFLNPTRVEDVEKAALSSVRMPPKSTYFYPKLLTGLVISKWDIQER
ncbi:MAG: DUF1015 domain-containing protein [Nitrospirota bacterium]